MQFRAVKMTVGTQLTHVFTINVSSHKAVSSIGNKRAECNSIEYAQKQFKASTCTLCLVTACPPVHHEGLTAVLEERY